MNANLSNCMDRDLIEQIKHFVAGNFDGSKNKGQIEQAANELSDKLKDPESTLIHLLRDDPTSTADVTRFLSQLEREQDIYRLISTISVSEANNQELQKVFGVELNTDIENTHKWIFDYNITEQRLGMINDVVLPYLIEKFPEKKIFRALKEYEAETLKNGKALVCAKSIYNIILNSKKNNGAPIVNITPPASGMPRMSPRLVMQNKTFSILLRLAWVSQEYLYDLLNCFNEDEFIDAISSLENIVPIYLIPTRLGYPMGGGESFMHQTCRILSEFGIKCVWISFYDPKHGQYQNGELTHTPYYMDIRYAGESSVTGTRIAVNYFNPDLIHTQGPTNKIMIPIAENCRIKAMIGYHFWCGLIELGESSNRKIINNIKKHKLSSSSQIQSPLVWKYAASEFMQDVYRHLGGSEKLNVIHPVSDKAQFYVDRDTDGIYVLQINIGPHKGGDIFLDCVKSLGSEIPFMGIESEPDLTNFIDTIKTEVSNHPLCKLNQYGNVRDYYRSARMVLVPTLVDETFCRVAFEAAMNGIPVISTTNGYLPSMLGDTGYYLSEESSEWIITIKKLYHDVGLLKKIGEAQRAYLKKMYRSDFCHFIDSAMNLIDDSTNLNIGIFTVWGDIGLGNLCHIYTRILRSVGYRVHIFSVQPYSMIGKGLLKQNDPNDWNPPKNADSVYYSFNHRESVTCHEVTQFILANNIQTLLVPEICWEENWRRLFELNVNNLKICSIPMIEIVIREEATFHNRLSKTLYCTKQAEKVLNEVGVTNGAFIGHGFGKSLPDEHITYKRDNLAKRGKIRFLHVAGHNPTVRKNTSKVIDGFITALSTRNDIELTVTSMDPIESYYTKDIPEGVVILDHSISRHDILKLYDEHDVSIQVSSHEGLGLGFYESISRGTPVISLDAPPHNEVILKGQTGWLIPSQPLEMLDNNRALVNAWQFNTDDLTHLILSLDLNAIDSMILSTHKVHRTLFNESALLTRFLKALPRNTYIHSNPTEELKEIAQLEDMEPKKNMPIIRKIARPFYRLALKIAPEMTIQFRSFIGHLILGNKETI